MTASCDVNRVSKKKKILVKLIDKKHQTDCVLIVHEVENVRFEYKDNVDTYTSTKTGKAASRNSSRQLGGYSI